jgi:hypothetical protein
MTTTAISNAVSDAAAGLPSGWTQYVADNIGSAAGQQAIVAAAANYGITNPATIASLVNQATGMNVTPQQVTQVAQSALQAPIQRSVATPTGASQSTPTSTGSGATPTDLGTSLSSMATPQFVGSAAPGAVGTSYGQASGDMISAAQQANPALAQALTSGNAAVNYNADTGTYNLIDKTTGAPIAGNYQVQVGPNGTGINIPSGNGMIQVTAQTDQSGTIAPVTAANVQNVGLNQGAGGFAGGPDAFMAAAGPAISVAFPEVAPYIAAYNSASAANKGQYGVALVNALSAAGIYAAQNPTSQIGQMVNGVIDSVTSSLPQSVQDALNTPTPTAPTTPSTPSGTNLGDLTNAQQLPGSVLNPNFVNTPQAGDLTNLSSLGTGTASLPLTNTPVPFTNMVGVSPTSTSVSSTAPTATNSTSPIVNNTGLPLSTPSTPSAAAPAAAAAAAAAAPAAASGAAVPVAAAAGLTAAQIAALAAAGVSLVNNSTLTNANNSAAATQAAAGQNAQNLIQGLYTQQGQLQSPYQQAGVNALNTLGSLGSGTYNIMNPTGGTTGTGTGSGYLTNQFNNTDLNAQLAPNYAFQLQQGQGQAQNAANVGGGLLSGNTLQGLNQYTQNYAQGAYQNAFTNYQTQRNNIYNNLAGQAGLGQNANAQLSSLSGGLAQTYGNVTTGLAASAAGQQVANAQNNTNLLSNLTNAAVTAFAPTPTPTQIVIKAPA